MPISRLPPPPPTSKHHSRLAGQLSSKLFQRLSLVDTPISIVPVELLAQIFLRATSLDVQNFKPSTSPLNITHTCTRWRDIAVDIPELWNAIEGEFSLPSPSILRLFLQRSKDLPLFVSVPRDSVHQFSSSTKEKEFVTLLIGESRRWRMLSVCYSAIFDCHAFHSLGPSDIPSLSTLRWLAGTDKPDLNHSWRVVQAATSFRTAIFNHPPSFGDWGHLTDLGLRATSAKLAIPTLRLCTELTRLTWLIKKRDTDISDPPVVLPKLKVLSLRLPVDDDFRVFEYLRAPMLATLSIVVQESTFPARHYWQLSKMLQTSECYLESFALDVGRSRLVGLPSLMRLANMQNLIKFCIRAELKEIPDLWGALPEHAELSVISSGVEEEELRDISRLIQTHPAVRQVKYAVRNCEWDTVQSILSSLSLDERGGIQVVDERVVREQMWGW
ncbi:hypothetical protein DL96DRAFT_423400 [Flagelloscypha sp. PMI_526]|nr:hypothetical protein DL96DRAFT_423400 [Flagelloscypha sp. PMI_526]